MKAIIYNKKSPSSKLELVEVANPEPNEDEVLVKIVSTSINAADYRSVAMGTIPKRKIFGSAVAGTLVSVGKNIQNFKPGDAVIGDLADFGFGGLAEYVAMSEKALVIKPPKISFEEAAALPVAATTALKALRDKGAVQKGQKVLVVGSAGGVGSFAVQLAKFYGAHVTAVCSERNGEQSMDLGADVVLDYTKDDFLKSADTYDLILAINGNYPLRGYKRALKAKGRCVVVGGALSQIFKAMFLGWMLSFGGKKIKVLVAKSNTEDLGYVVGLLEKGSIKAPIEKAYSLDNAIEAWDYISQGHAKGKVIINV